MSEYPSNSTYVAPVTITDRNGDPLVLSNADVTYALTEYESGGEEYFGATEADSAVEIEPNNQTGLVRVTVPADAVTQARDVWEELRVAQPGTSIALLKREVTFTPAATDP